MPKEELTDKAKFIKQFINNPNMKEVIPNLTYRKMEAELVYRNLGWIHTFLNKPTK